MFITINPADNVAVAFTEQGHIPAGHKIALRDIKKGDQIIKYGYPIGVATADIKKDEHVHVHNLKTALSGIIEYEYKPDITPVQKSEGTFMGYRRKDGKVGIRNEVWIINTVGCVNKIAEKIAAKFEDVYTFVHPYGCSQLGDDHAYTQNILKNMVNHPNAAGVLVLGLGCENNHIDEFKQVLGKWDDDRVKFLNAQDVDDDEAEGTKIVEGLLKYAANFKREAIPVSELVIGLKCGGSDGLSGITANPLVGSFTDILTSKGGSCLLTEVPEMFGAETILMNRCINEEVFDKSVALINDFKNYFIRHNQEIYENPSPGNKDGGISTLEEKSLGCTQKGGTSPVVDVLAYGETVKTPGLNLLQGPGNDIVAVTNLTAAGAHIVLFTTGRGTPVGGPVPTVKISSNTPLAKSKPHWIDYNAVDAAPEDFFSYITSIASGEKTQNEINDYREIAIFKDGVTL